MTRKEFGKWLTTTRTSLQISQEHLAKKIGFSGSELAKIEAGIADFPKAKMKALVLHLKVEKKFELQLKLLFEEDKKKAS